MRSGSCAYGRLCFRYLEKRQMNASVSSRVWNFFRQMSGKLPGSVAIKAGVFTATALLVVSSAHAQRVTTTVGAGTAPAAIEVNPVTNKVYVANNGSNNV